MESRSFSLIRMKCEIREMRFETKNRAFGVWSRMAYKVGLCPIYRLNIKYNGKKQDAPLQDRCM